MLCIWDGEWFPYLQCRPTEGKGKTRLDRSSVVWPCLYMYVCSVPYMVICTSRARYSTHTVGIQYAFCRPWTFDLWLLWNAISLVPWSFSHVVAPVLINPLQTLMMAVWAMLKCCSDATTLLWWEVGLNQSSHLITVSKHSPSCLWRSLANLANCLFNWLTALETLTVVRLTHYTLHITSATSVLQW